MPLFPLITLLIVLTATLGYVNHRFVRLPPSIGMMFLALLCSLMVVGIGYFVRGFHDAAAGWMRHIDFNRLLLHGLLSLLLFAGCLHLDVDVLLRRWGAVTLLAVVGTVVSTFIVAVLCYWVMKGLGLSLDWMDCLIFGALISPTDPVAVLGIMKRLGASPQLETLLAGEALFNDGVGVVMFVTLLELARGGVDVSAMRITLFLCRQVIGGMTLGLWAGVLIYQLLKRLDRYQLAVMLTLALAMGCYELAEMLGVSAPLAVVVAGLFIGHRRRAFAMSAKTREHLDAFWELVDETLNALLFLLMGLEVLVMPFNRLFLLAGLGMIPAVLLARFLSVGGIVAAMRGGRTFERGALAALTWGGLRGGIAIALALSIPSQNPGRDLILAITYLVAVFSIVVQGLTIGRVVRAAVGLAEES